MYGPLPIAPVLERIQLRVPALKFVGNAADLQTALEQQPKAVPAAYVVSQERAGKLIEMSEFLEQEIDVLITLVLFVRNRTGQASGAAARAEADTLLRDLRRALIGWVPDDCRDPLQFSTGRDEGYKNGLLVGQEIYKTKYRTEVEVDE